MTPQFTFPPELYRKETATLSKFWYLWAPLLTVVATLFIAWIDRPFFKKWFESEQTGLFEFLHFLLPVITALIAIRCLFHPFVRKNKFLIFWFAIMAIGGIYLGGEEASWGQHYAGWTTPEFWVGVNDQQETNLHNTSFLLDQYPRAILKVGMVIGAIFTPWFLLNKPHLPMRQFDFVYPPLAMVPLTLFVLITEVYNKLQGEVSFKIFSLLRGGELQETFISWWLVYYAFCLLWRLQTISKADIK